MGKTKNLNDVIYGDRADVRAAQIPTGTKIIESKVLDNGHRGFERCYHSHPQLKIRNGIIIGGSCNHPVTNDADVYIGFDSGMLPIVYDYTSRCPHQIYHHIRDMGAPQNLGGFKKLVSWTIQQLDEGKTVHCGCIGGHGRTGTFLSALVCEALGETDAVTWVRTNYCHKVVESSAQMDFLEQHYGIKPVVGSKQSTSSKGKKSHSGYSSVFDEPTPPKKSKKPKVESFAPLGSLYDIFAMPK